MGLWEKQLYMKNNINNWISNVTPGLLCATLPDSFDKYWESVRTNARTEYRKAVKNSISFIKLDKVPHQDILDVWNSWDGEEKQGRELNKRYNAIDGSWHPIEGKWVIDDYSPYNYEDADLSFFGVSSDDKCVGYIECVRYGDKAAVHSILGHKDYLKHGIMKMLIMDAIKYYIPLGVTGLYYGDSSFLQDKRRFFMRDLGFK